MPSSVLRFLLLYGAILPRRARPLLPTDEYVIAAPAAFVVSEEIPTPDAILPAVLVLHITAPFLYSASAAAFLSRYLLLAALWACAFWHS